MKMRLNICGEKLKDIRQCLRELADDDFDSNCRGKIGNAEYDYDFLSGDIDRDDNNKDVINPKG